MRRLLLFLTLGGASVLACSGVVFAQQTDRTTPASERQSTSPDSSQALEEVVPGEVLVKFRDGTPAPKKKEVHGKKGGKAKKTIEGIDVQVVEVPSGKEKPKAKEYKADPSVEFAEPNGFYHALDGTKEETANTKEETNTERPAPGDAAEQDRTDTKESTNEYATASWTSGGLPNDPRFGQQWQYRQTSDKDIDADEAWEANNRGNIGIRIAVLDTGIDQSHKDLKNKLIKNKNFTSSSTVDDYRGHGTHVAGSAAASTDNSVGVAGTCPKCALYNAKVLSETGTGSWSGIANGIAWAVDPNNDGATGDGAKVINMSLGGSYSDTVRLAVEYAWEKGVIVAAAAGNDGKSSDVYSLYPGAYPDVIAVASTNSSDAKADTSNYNGSDPSKHYVDVAAPGVSILSTAPDNRNKIGAKGVEYGTLSGTSMATAHVAGLAGLVWAAKDSSGRPLCSTNTCVRERIEQGAEQISGTGTLWTHGRINAKSSLSSSP